MFNNNNNIEVQLFKYIEKWVVQWLYCISEDET